MNDKQIADLTFRLQEALDQNYDIVNMDAVLSVIATLEGTPITREQLEATRLAKYINQLRRRTTSNNLAQRSKSLVKKWRAMCNLKQQPSSVPATTTAVQPSSQSQQHQPQQQQTTITSQQYTSSLQNNITDGRGGCSTNMLMQITKSTTILTTTSSLTISANANVYNINSNREHIIPALTKTMFQNQQNNNNDIACDHVDDNSMGCAKANVLQSRQYHQTADNCIMDNQMSKATTTTQPTSFANIFREGKRPQSDYKQHNNNNNNNSNSNNNIKSSLSPQQQHQHLQQDKMETFIIDQSSSNSNSMKTIGGNQQMPAQIVIDIQDSNSSHNLTPIQQQTTPATTAAVTKQLASGTKLQNMNESSISYHLLSPSPVTVIAPTTTTTPTTTFNLNSNENSSITKTKKDKKRYKDRDLFSKENKQTEPLIVMIDDTSLSLSQSQQQQMQTTKTQQQQQLRRNNKHETLDIINAEEKSRLTLNPTASNMSEALSLSNSSMSSLFPNETFGGGILSGRAMDYQNTNTKIDGNHSVEEKTKSSELTFAGKFIKHQQNNSGILATNDFTLLSTNNNANDMHSNTMITTSSTKPIDTRTTATMQQQQHFLPFRDNVPYEQQQLVASNNLKSTTNVSGDTIDTIMTTSSSNLVKFNEKLPKKRGRKKGSKGVDSIIAKETSLSSQMLISTLGGCKKVKTTKELYAEMQNRKLYNQQATPNSTSPLPTVMQMNWANNSNSNQLPQQQQQQQQLQQQQQQQISRPTSSCSEPSLNSPRTLDACSTNATISTMATRSTPENFLVNSQPEEADSASGDTMTSDDYSQDSTAASSTATRKQIRDFSIDSNSNTLLPNSMRDPISDNNNKKPIVPVVVPATTSTQQQHPNVVATLSTLEKQLNDLLKQLSTSNAVQTDDRDNLAYGNDRYSCTCEIQEVTLSADQLEQQQQQQQQQIKTEIKCEEGNLSPSQSLFNKPQQSDDVNCDEQQIKLSSSLTSSPQSRQYIDTTAHAKELQNVKVVHQQQQQQQHTADKLVKRPVKKSIFDLDFDDDDDPLHTLMAEAAALKVSVSSAAASTTTSTTTNTNATIHDYDIHHDSIDNEKSQKPIDSQTKSISIVEEDGNLYASMNPLNVPFVVPMYQVHEDANCAAKERFEVQTQKITKFHVNTLHNCFIPNVNGNWDYGGGEHHINTIQSTTANDCKMTIANEINDGSNVVPKYGALIAENLRKDLRYVNYSRHLATTTPSHRQQQHLFTEFLGVARGLLAKKLIASSLSLHTKLKTELCAKCQQKSVTKIDTPENNAINNCSADMTSTSCNDVTAVHNSIPMPMPNCDRDNATTLSTSIQSLKESQTFDDRPIAMHNHAEAKQQQQSVNNCNEDTMSTNIEQKHATTVVSGSAVNVRKRNHNDRKRHRYNHQHLTSVNVNNCGDGDDGDDDDEDNDNERKKPRVIKRLKIAFNGDVTSKLEIYNIDDSSSNKSYNSSSGDGGGGGGGGGDGSSATDTDNDDDDDDVDGGNNNDNPNYNTKHSNAVAACDDRIDNATPTATSAHNLTQKQHSNDIVGNNNGNADAVALLADIAATTTTAAADTATASVEQNDGDDYDYNDDDEYDDDDDDEYNCNSENYHHEIVARSSTNRSNNHIVLTIKKTPSKINSPSTQSPLSSTSSSVTTTTVPIETSIVQNETTNDNKTSIAFSEELIVDQQPSNELLALPNNTQINNNSNNGNGHADSRFLLTKTTSNAATTAAAKRKHKTAANKMYACPSLFFPYELYRRFYKISGTNAYEGYIFQNAYDVDSNDDEDGDDDAVDVDVDNNTANELNAENCKTKSDAVVIKHDDSCSKEVTKSSCRCECAPSDMMTTTMQQQPSYIATDVNLEHRLMLPSSPSLTACTTTTTTTTNTNTYNDNQSSSLAALKVETIKEEMVNDDDVELIVENNGLLLSFNHIDPNDITTATADADVPINNDNSDQLIQLPPNQNCDVYINNNNNNNKNNINNNTLFTRNNNNNHNNNEHDSVNNLNNDNYNDNKSDSNHQQQHHRNHNESIHVIDNNNTTIQNSNERQQQYNNNNNNNNIKPKNSYQNNSTNTYNLPLTNAITNAIARTSDVNQLTTTTTTTTTAITKRSPSSSITTMSPSSSSSILKKEYISGLRAVDVDVDDEHGKNCGRIQQFKEWHQVLQLRSYNDELLTVLPYVVLD